MRGGPSALRPPLPSPVPPHALDSLITQARATSYRQVLARRTGRLAVIIEECYDPHNASAIIRTCDAFGIHRLYVVAARNGFKINRRVSQGSHFYLELGVHGSIADAYAAARADGYRILASDLATRALTGPSQLAAALAAHPLALAFGTEGAGLSPEAVAGADGHFIIPMCGFPQSLNLSVAVAATIYGLRGPALEADAPGDLSAAEQCRTYERWVREHKGPVADQVLRQQGRHGEDLDVLRSAPAP
jgi:tRNA (guanosine-2'-O-)-methyltransferase